MNIEQIKSQYAEGLDALICPLCGEAFTIRQNSLLCSHGHCFDFSRKGYINLVPSHFQEKDRYTETLFQARKAVFDAGFYLPIVNEITGILNRLYGEAPFSLLDVGCGEGYYARTLADRFPKARIWGCDISRAAILSAAQTSHRPLWMIADLKKLPFREHGINVLLDILTPADYAEFRRITGDYLIKVIPGKGYLREIRHAVSSLLSGGEQYDNQPVIEHLRQNMTVLEERHLFYSLPVSEALCGTFLKMTPLTFSISEKELETIRLSEITVDMNLFLCRNR